MPKSGVIAEAAYIEGAQKCGLIIPMAPISLDANELLALVVFGTLSERLFGIPLIAETLADCRELSMHHTIMFISCITKRYEKDPLSGSPSGLIGRVDDFLKSLAKKFPWDKGKWVITAYKEILAKWEEMAKKITRPSKAIPLGRIIKAGDSVYRTPVFFWKF